MSLVSNAPTIQSTGRAAARRLSQRWTSMNFAIRLFTFLLTGILLIQTANAQPGGSRADLEAMFANISQKTKWDISKDMLWGYFFTHSTRAKLDVAAKDLSKIGYRIVDVYLSEKKNPSAPDLWWLHVERIESHSVDSLLKRNAELTAFAKTHGLSSYDGMDVGPVSDTKK